MLGVALIEKDGFYPFMKAALMLLSSANKIYQLIKYAYFILILMFAGCSHKGDFGRPEPRLWENLVNEGVNALLYDSPAINNLAPGSYTGYIYNLTQDEINLRDIAAHYSLPLRRETIIPLTTLEPISFAEDLTTLNYSDGATRVAYISSQIKSDQSWLSFFSKTAKQIKKDDDKRIEVLKSGHLTITNQDRVRTVSRIHENRRLINYIFENLSERTANYMYAIERTKLETPSANLLNVKVDLELLRKNIVIFKSTYDKIARENPSRFTTLVKKHKPIRKKVGYSKKSTQFKHKSHDSKINDLRLWLSDMVTEIGKSAQIPSKEVRVRNRVKSLK